MKFSKILSGFSACFLSAAIITASVPAKTFAEQTLSGEGTQASPYVIYSSSDLKEFCNIVNSGNTNACASLAADISLNSSVSFDTENGTVSGGTPESWNAVGSSENKYSGSFYGNGHIIKGIYINDESTDSPSGLFGSCNGAKIIGVNVTDSVIKSKSPCGAIVGSAENTDISDCTSSGFIENTFNDIRTKNEVIPSGGILGFSIINNTITNCTNNAAITSYSAGGICGKTYKDIHIEKCRNNGKIHADTNVYSYAGGIVGMANNYCMDETVPHPIAILNCCNFGSVNGYGYAGGILGYEYFYDTDNNSDVNYGIDGRAFIDIESCFSATDDITSTSNSPGAIIGLYDKCDHNPVFANIFYLQKDGLVNLYSSGYAEETDNAITAEQFASGEVAFKLNNQKTEGELVWGQTIGTDNYPIYGGKTVYRGWDCRRSQTVYEYSNEKLIEGHQSDERGICTICNKPIDKMSSLYGYSAYLDGKIGLNFIMKIEKNYIPAYKKTTQMIFRIKHIDETTGEEIEKEKQTITITASNKIKINGTDYYKATCYVPVMEMTDIIEANYYYRYSNVLKNGTVFKKSVADYANDLLNDSSTDEKTRNLVKSMLNLGGYSQKYFGYNTEKPANAQLSAEDKILPDINSSELENYSYEFRKNESYTGKTEYFGSSLVLQSGTEIKHYFSTDENSGNITCKDSNGKNYKVSDQSGLKVVKIADISADKLGTPVTITIYEDETKVGTISYSPLSYVYKLMQKYPHDEKHEDLRNTVKAMYRYFIDACTYKEN